MSLKSKLISMIVAVILAVSALTIGVLAVKTANFNVGGTINFTAKGINATVSKGVVAGGSVENETNKMLALSYSTKNSVTNNEASWDNLVLNMAEEGNLTIKFTITNTSEKADDLLYVKIEAEALAEASPVSISVDGANTIPSKTNNAVEYTITFAVDSSKVDVDGSETFKVNVTLANTPLVKENKVRLNFNIYGDSRNSPSCSLTSLTGADWVNPNDETTKFKYWSSSDWTDETWKNIDLKFKKDSQTIVVVISALGDCGPATITYSGTNPYIDVTLGENSVTLKLKDGAEFETIQEFEFDVTIPSGDSTGGGSGGSGG